MIESLKFSVVRDLDKLKRELTSYKNPNENIWISKPEVSYSAGNLCLHLLGNLNHFIGAVLGNTGYIRNRDLELSQKDIPVDELIKQIDETILTVEKTFDNITTDMLNQDYPILFNNQKITTCQMLINTVCYLNYHLGQINIHRKLFNKSGE
ncbi:MAG TPA: DUF1572 family protein [Ignavibacteriaceae bacterium]|jgi:hypothetical protein|nr:MAG: hypothetical protein BWY38_02833 [Ignavibacteria bacterium ADurb.Bin266]OQY70455.1 MAG: DinB superfamily protein [Ignavibacteriales bacterium UTCHB2]HQF42636.1 DUF1572 family protein [Ignavibacteriaceae bacterium]HQI42234.1 DUF1572 family protein [Ignavibacteriaceae bacterium]HQJ46162.1 DUF1572 family protein [Ignavibacteriaceae bacterium]